MDRLCDEPLKNINKTTEGKRKYNPDYINMDSLAVTINTADANHKVCFFQDFFTVQFMLMPYFNI